MPSYKSGYCGIGAHEGTTPKNKNGNALPTCKMTSAQCSCKCHTDLDMLFKLTEKDRITVDSSAYVPDRGDFVMPSLDEIALERRNNAPSESVEHIESPDPALVPPSIRRTFAPTVTGRSGRGELEQQVDEVCKTWLIDKDGELCIPKYISEQIEKKYGIKAPSVGAIGAVFDRWTDIGYADCQRKPVRFVAYTPEGLQYGLDGCKERARRRRLAAR